MVTIETLNRIELDASNGRKYSLSFYKTGSGQISGVTAKIMEKKVWEGKEYWDDGKEIGRIEFN